MWLYNLLIFLILFYLVYDRLTRKYVNPYKLIMVFGKKGSGKTTYLTKVAINAIRKGQKVYSTIDIPGCNKFDVQQLGYYTFEPESLVLIDEVGIIWDNRDFKSFKPAVRDFFKYQRQYRLKVLLFSQTFDIDLKLRNLTDEMYLLTNKFRVFSVARRINKTITIYKGGEGRPSTLADDFEFAPLLSYHAFQVTFIPRWQAFYQSFDPPYIPFIDSEWLQMSEFQEAMTDNKNYYKYSLKRLFESFVAYSKTKWIYIKGYIRSIKPK